LIFALFPSDARYEKLAHSLRCRILAHPELLQGMMTAFLDTPEQRAMLMQHLKKNPRLMAHLSEEALRVLSQHAQSEHYQSNLQKLLRGIMRPSPTPHVAQTVSLLFKFFGAGVHGLTAKATPETSASAAP
jgi:hypothetical protein